MHSFVTENASAIGAIGQVISAIFAAAIIYQIRIMSKGLEIDRETTKAEHEFMRRKAAIDIVATWHTFIPFERKAVESFINSLNDDQCHCIIDGRSLIISVDHKNFKEWLTIIMFDRFKDIESEINISIAENSGKIVLNSIHVAYIRSVVVKYLNYLEWVFSAWDHNVADKMIIELQFSSIVLSEGKSFEIFKNLGGGNAAFPATHNFIKEVSQKSEPKAGKSPTA